MIQTSQTLVRLSRAINHRLLNLSYRQRRIRVWGMPWQVMIEPTNACNARCPLCPTGRGELTRPLAMMPLTIFKRLVDEIYWYTDTVPLWNYGEPFLHRQIFDMIRYARGRRLTVRISTNGTVFYERENASHLIDSGLDHLTVSLDGATPATLTRYRVGVDFERVLEGLRHLAAEKKKRQVAHPLLNWQFVVMRHNEHEIEAARQLAGEVGAHFTLKTVNVQMVNAADAEDYIPSDARFSRYTSRPDGALQHKAATPEACYFPWYGLVVNADGQVVPCCYDYHSEMILGDVNRETIRQVWNGSRLQAIRRAFVADRPPAPCARCSMDTLAPGEL